MQDLKAIASIQLPLGDLVLEKFIYGIGFCKRNLGASWLILYSITNQASDQLSQKIKFIFECQTSTSNWKPLYFLM